MKRVWLPEELKPYQVARLALGVVPENRPKENLEDPMTYGALYRQKVLRAIRKSQDYGENALDVLDTLLLAGPRVRSAFGPKPSPEDLLAPCFPVSAYTTAALSFEISSVKAP